MSGTGHRILVISHAHPDFSLGGGELAAYTLFRAYADHPGVESAHFLARHDRGRGATGAISPRRANEYLWEQGIGDWFRMKAAHAESLNRSFADLVAKLRPTVVHVHHYAHMGLEFLHVLRREVPDARIVLTLHEYMAICFNQGQMIKTGSNRLCFRESPDDCHRCFPDRSIEDFWLRKHRFRSFFRMVDQFVAPSDFLRRRYVDWGIAPERIVTIENGHERRDPLPPRPLAEGETRNRFAFFGDITPQTGIEVLLRGLTALGQTERQDIALELHGEIPADEHPDFRERIVALRAALEKSGTLQWIGPYEPFQLTSRMGSVDWVVIPSIWWESSPANIRDAFSMGRPVVGSDIGGVAEKISHGIDGVHVPVGNQRAWGQTLCRLARSTDEWEKLRAGIRRPVTCGECADAHLVAIDQLAGEVIA